MPPKKLTIAQRLARLDHALDELPADPDEHRAQLLAVTILATEEWPNHARPRITELRKRLARCWAMWLEENEVP